MTDDNVLDIDNDLVNDLFNNLPASPCEASFDDPLNPIAPTNDFGFWKVTPLFASDGNFPVFFCVKSS